MQPTSRTWTNEQQQAITTTGHSLLVSAAAGSGKTSVLAERCVHLLCDADPCCDVDELLVVTFTEAAAAEMKSRIARSLSLRHAIRPSDATTRHLALLDRAAISTLHQFCSRVLREHFQLLGLDPEFRILDADESALLKLDTARKLFDERYDDEQSDDFRWMVDCYGDGKDERLMTQVIRAYDTLCSVADPAGWLEEARDRINEAIDLPMNQSRLGVEHAKIIHRDLQSVLNECRAAGEAMKGLGNFAMYVDYLRELWKILQLWMNALQRNGIDALAEVSQSTELPKMPRVSGLIEGKDMAKGLVDSVRNAMKTGIWRKNLLFTTEQWQQGLSDTLPHVDVFLSLVSQFAEKYTAVKDEQGTLDFADLEVLTLRCLREPNSNPPWPSSQARQYQRQFKHVLVDEYQDINQVQDAILSLVSRERLAEEGKATGNLFCVGDVKQSIYRFRLAETKQFLDRRARYSEPGSHGRVIDLQKNFRSRAPLLAAINTVFEKLMTRDAANLDYDASQRLEPGTIFPNIPNGFAGAPIELHLLPKDLSSSGKSEDDEEPLERSEREAALLGHLILELVGKRDRPALQVVDRSGVEPTSRPIRFSDIVLLLRSMRFKADEIASVLRSMGVPVHAESATGYFEATEVNDVLSLLHVLDNQRQDIHLAALLRSPLAQMPDAETNLARIRIAYSGTPPVPFHLAVQKYAAEQADALAEFLRAFLAKIEKWRHEARQQSVADLLWGLYEQTHYLVYVAGLVGGEQRQANLIELHDRARQFGTFQRQGLGRFLTFLEKLKKETDLGEASIASQADDVVRIMSIHGSKGQEFPVVLIPDLGKAINMLDSQGSILLDRSAGLGLQVVADERQIRYPSLASTVVQQKLRQQTLAEELRILYVAMTRAKEHLIMAGTCVESQPQRWVQQWANHVGTIPAETVLGARTPLDWLGPVAAIAPDQFAITMHSVDEVAAWTAESSAARELSPMQAMVFTGAPLSPPPVVPAEARELIARLNWKYPFEAVADVAAAASVTSLVKKSAVIPLTQPLPSQSVDRLLGRPTFLAGQLPPDAADIGTATHAVLEHFDFQRIDEPGTIDSQIQHMIETKRLSKELSEQVDHEAIAWFLGSDVGRALGRNANGLKRELPVYFADPSDAANNDPLDQPMIRGRIDLLAPTADGWMIVDYKTDRVSGPALEERTAMYAGQLEIYRKAMRQITGKNSISAAVVFLHAREIRVIE